MVSRDHPRTQFYIRSRRDKRLAETSHLLYHFYMIHPLSKLVLYRNFLMFFVLSGFYIILPFLLIFLRTKNMLIFRSVSTLQVIFMAEMIMTCFTGYYDKNRVVLKPRRIMLRYLKTYLIWDLMSIAPFFAKRAFNLMSRPEVITSYWKLFFIGENLKIVRYYYWFDCYQQMMEYYEVPKNISSGAGFVIRIWFALFLGFSVRQCVRSLETVMNFQLLKLQIFIDFYDMVVQFLGVSHGVEVESIKNHALSVIYLCVGFCFLVKIFCLFWQHLNKFFSISFSETLTYSQYEAYAAYIGLSPELKDRIHMFLDFKYRTEYYKEHIIRDILSNELLKEIRKCVARSRLEKVKLFSAVPDDLKTKLEEHLLSDIYLPGDIIIKAGTKGNYLYFIVTGTVIVTNAAGEHICFLEDGANFGEIALILNHKRTTTIISATACELLVLKQSDLESVLNPYPEIQKALRREALQRLKATVESEAEGPICHLSDKGRDTKSNTDINLEDEDIRVAFKEAMKSSHNLQLAKSLSTVKHDH